MTNNLLALAFFASLCLGACRSTEAAPALAAPTSLYVTACGSSKMALYWNKVKGARGYLIYRSTKSRRFNHGAPIAKLYRVPDSYTSSPMKLWVDRGLVNGREYFYAVRAVGIKGKFSAPSKQDSDVVDPQGVPWDTRDPKKIVQHCIKEANAASLDGEPISPRSSFIIAGPDGYTYERSPKGQYSSRKPDPMPNFAMPTA